MHPGGETPDSTSHDWERGSRSRLAVKLGETHGFGGDSGNQHMQRAPERLFIKSPQAAGATQTPHATNPTPLLWRDEDGLGQTLNSANTKGNTEGASGGRWEHRQEKG